MFGAGQFLTVAERVLSDVYGWSTDSVAAWKEGLDAARVLALLEAPYVECGGHPLYPDPVERVAVLGLRIVEAGLLGGGADLIVALLFTELALNGIELELDTPTSELDRIFRSIRDRSTSEDQFIVWVGSHTRPLRTFS